MSALRRPWGRLTVAATIVAATVLLVVTLTTGGQRRPDRPSRLPDQGRWVAMPAVPIAARADLDGAQMATVGGRVYVSVVNRGFTARSPSLAAVYELAGQRWRGPVGGGPVRVNRGAQVSLTGGDHLCVSAPFRREVLSQCLQGSRWSTIGSRVFETTSPEPVVSFGGATDVGGRLLIGRAELQGARAAQGGVAVTGRLSNTFYASTAKGWQRLGGDLNPDARRGTQRPFLAAYRGRTCAAFDHVQSRPGASPEVQVRCLGSTGGWRDVGVPPLTNPDPHARSAINTDGIAAIGDALYVGLDNFGVPDVRWTVHRFDGRRWSALPPTSPNDGWNDQGTLYALHGALYAVVFGQRPARGGLQTRLRVLTLDRGRWRQVGAPLLRQGRFAAPLYWDLTAADGRLYAMATVPTRRRSYDVTVHVLR